MSNQSEANFLCCRAGRFERDVLEERQRSAQDLLNFIAHRTYLVQSKAFRQFFKVQHVACTFHVQRYHVYLVLRKTMKQAFHFAIYVSKTDYMFCVFCFVYAIHARFFFRTVCDLSSLKLLISYNQQSSRPPPLRAKTRH